MWHDAWQTNWQIWTKRMTVKWVKPMSRMADLDAAIAELRKCGEAIISVSDALRTSFSTETEQPALPPLPTIDQVRALLAEKSGEGKYTWQDGSVYEGTFDANLRHGHGVLTTAGGDSYDGGFERDKKSGEGKYTWANGDSYEGTYLDDMCSGKGKMTWSNGETYEGEFRFNTLNGEGTYTWPSGRVYQGVFENGLIIRVDYDNGIGEDPDVIGDTK